MSESGDALLVEVFDLNVCQRHHAPKVKESVQLAKRR